MGWINKALEDVVTAEPNRLVGEEIRCFTINLQDSISDESRNSERWRSLIPRLVGTAGAGKEAVHKIALDWMWNTVLPQAQVAADEAGIGEAWQKMREEKTVDAARSAKAVACDGLGGLAPGSLLSHLIHTLNWITFGDPVNAADALTHAVPDLWDRVDPCGVVEQMIAVAAQGDTANV